MKLTDNYPELEPKNHPKGLYPRRRCKLCNGTGLVPGVTKLKGKGMGSNFGHCPECEGQGFLEQSDET